MSDSLCWLLLLPVIIWSSISMSLPPLCCVSLLSLLSGLAAGEPDTTEEEEDRVEILMEVMRAPQKWGQTTPLC